jgi:exodeoxyribonuclease V alpha subunit
MNEEYYVGRVQSVIFANAPFYIVRAIVVSEKSAKSTSVKGNFIGGVHPGTVVVFRAKTVKDPKHGESLQITQIPVSSSLLKGDALLKFKEWLPNPQERLTLDTLSSLAEAGLNPKQINLVLPEVLSNPNVLTENPWKFVLKGIPFKVADQFASFNKVRFEAFQADNIDRVIGAIYSVLLQTLKEGNCYVGSSTLFIEVNKLANITDPDVIKHALAKMNKDGNLIIDQVKDSKAYCLYLPTYYNMEKDVASLLTDPSRRRNPALFTDAEVQAFCDYPLTPEQISAIRLGVREPVSILTGLPGTGKTTTVKTLCRILQHLGENVLLVAPTGIAAKRMEAVTGIKATTIHRAFAAGGKEQEKNFSDYTGLKKETDGYSNADLPPLDPTLDPWGYGPLHKRPESVLIVDESSMIDLHLAWRMLRGISLSCRVIFVGDVAQLPPVGAGLVLRDMIEANVSPKTYLNKTFRQEEGSSVIQVAHDIHNGKVPTLGKEYSGEATEFHNRLSLEAVTDQIINVCHELKENNIDFHVMSPTHHGDAGVTAINKALRDALNPPHALSHKPLRVGDDEVRVGDRVMITKNDYDLEVFNGDIGVLNSIEKGGVEVLFYNGANATIVQIPTERISNLLRLAYATTVHKAQGQEYHTIVMPLMPEFGSFGLSRNLVYTAVTRAKNRVILVGDRQALAMAVSNGHGVQRNSRLKERLLECVK